MSLSRTVKLFRVTVSTNRTEFVATNDLSQASTDAVQDVCDVRWKIEEFHRELKQLTGVEACQCRKARIQPNYIACALLVWSRLKRDRLSDWENRLSDQAWDALRLLD